MATRKEQLAAKHMAYNLASVLLGQVNYGSSLLGFAYMANPYASEWDKALFRKAMDELVFELGNRADKAWRKYIEHD